MELQSKLPDVGTTWRVHRFGVDGCFERLGVEDRVEVGIEERVEARFDVREEAQR